MFAKIEHTDQIPTDAATAYAMTEVGTGQTVVLTLSPSDGEYTVVEQWSGPSSAEEPGAATLNHFEGPISDARRQAGDYGFHNRVKPALEQVPGYVGGMLLNRASDGSQLVFGLATTMEALEACGKAVVSTTLLPGEDPALLTGPDRVVVHRVNQVKRG
jgi:hypothetical protein